MNDMKYCALLFIAILFSCASRKDRIEDLIKEDLSEKMGDFSSYDPLSTEIDSAFADAFSDSVIINYAKSIEIYARNIESFERDIKSKTDLLEISYSKSTYEEIDSMMRSMKNLIEESKNLEEKIADRSSKMKHEFVGFGVKHKFRCKTGNGRRAIGEVYYIINSDLDRIIFSKIVDEEQTGYEKFIKESIDRNNHE